MDSPTGSSSREARTERKRKSAGGDGNGVFRGDFGWFYGEGGAFDKVSYQQWPWGPLTLRYFHGVSRGPSRFLK